MFNVNDCTYTMIRQYFVKFMLKVFMCKNCLRKIRDKEQSDVNEFLECHIVHIVKPFFRLHHSSAEKEGKGEQ